MGAEWDRRLLCEFLRSERLSSTGSLRRLAEECQLVLVSHFLSSPRVDGLALISQTLLDFNCYCSPEQQLAARFKLISPLPWCGCRPLALTTIARAPSMLTTHSARCPDTRSTC